MSIAVCIRISCKCDLISDSLSPLIHNFRDCSHLCAREHDTFYSSLEQHINNKRLKRMRFCVYLYCYTVIKVAGHILIAVYQLKHCRICGLDKRYLILVCFLRLVTIDDLATPLFDVLCRDLTLLFKSILRAVSEIREVIFVNGCYCILRQCRIYITDPDRSAHCGLSSCHILFIHLKIS